jgi:hypothetical protein
VKHLINPGQEISSLQPPGIYRKIHQNRNPKESEVKGRLHMFLQRIGQPKYVFLKTRKELLND